MCYLTSAIIPKLMHQIPSELRSQACFGESSTRICEVLVLHLFFKFFLFLRPFYHCFLQLNTKERRKSLQQLLPKFLQTQTTNFTSSSLAPHQVLQLRPNAKPICTLIVQYLIGAIIPSQIYRIPSELRSQACLGKSSTTMGDLLGRPRVAPLFEVFFFFFTSFSSSFFAIKSKSTT